jgi:hypothetical protein
VTHLPIPLSRHENAYRAGAAALALLALTSVHHIYGAIAFATPWRMHILAAVVPAAAAIVGALYLGAKTGDGAAARRAMRVAAAIILVFPVAAIGIYEGGYNHVVKNLVYALGGEEVTLAVFPPPLYELPRDFVFEASGIAQFPLAIWTAILALRLWRDRGR